MHTTKQSPLAAILAALSFLAILTDPAPGQWLEYRFEFSGADSGDLFGHAVAVHGDFAIVGAPGDDEMGQNAGAAYVFVSDGPNGIWEEVTKLTAEDPGAGDVFGWAVAISGDYAVVGAKWDDWNGPGSGSAYVFFRNSRDVWSQQAKLTPSDPSGTDHFGFSVAMDGRLIAVGAVNADQPNGTVGAMHVFRRSGSRWSEEAKLTATDSDARFFGWAVAAEADRVLVGAPWGPSTGQGWAARGAAYVFEREEGHDWVERAKLIASDGHYFAWFGLAVSMSGERLVAGAPAALDQVRVGAAYIYEWDTPGGGWVETKLVPSDGADGDSFGNAVALDGERLVVASANDDDAGTSSGSVYLFDIEEGVRFQTKLTAADAAPGDQFGWSVSASGESVLVGAWMNDALGQDSGAAYLYAPGVLGDMNCDESVNGADIDPFFMAVGDPPSYLAAYPNCNINHADVNGDGIVNGADIVMFLECVGNGGCP